LPFQAALREGKIFLIQRFLFAANLDKPKLYEIFESIMKPVRTVFEKGKAAFNQQDMEKLVAELEAFCTLVKEWVQTQITEAAAQKATSAPEAPSIQKTT